MAVTYPPLNTLKPVCPEIWIVDGPVIRASTRMTLIRIGGDLLVHSPTPLADGLPHAISGIGPVRWIVAPNRQHYGWIPDWHAAYPEAEVYLAAGIVQQARIDFPHQQLPRAGGYPWDSVVLTLPVSSGRMTEVTFFHRPSRTLVLTDLVENIEAAPQSSTRLTRLLDRFAQARTISSGGMTAEMRQKFSQHLPQLRQAIEQMLALDPQRIIIAHGSWYRSDGAAELRRAFAWLLKPAT